MIVKYKRIFFAISGILVAFSLAAVVWFGLPLGIDFTGGSLIEVRYEGVRPPQNLVTEQLNALSLGDTLLRSAGQGNYLLKTKALTDTERTAVLNTLSVLGDYPATLTRFTSIGPVVGEELRNRAYIAIGIVILVIVLFITFAFRKVSEPVSSWKFGIATIIALIHDVIIPTGVMAFLGYFLGIEIDALFVVALLTILGFSVHDTIVVFDRVREHLRLNKEHNRYEDFELTVGGSINQTMVRSINTSLTTLLSLTALLIFGPASTFYFALMLVVGITA